MYRDLWAATNNTVGFNHMIASGPDAAAYAGGAATQSVALALETMYHYTAYFADNDPREVHCTDYAISILMHSTCMCDHCVIVPYRRMLCTLIVMARLFTLDSLWRKLCGELIMGVF